MGKPALIGDPTAFLVTPAQVKYNGVDLGFVSAIKSKMKHETTEVKTDQLGKTVANHFHVGDTLSVELTIDEINAKKIKAAFPFAALVGSFPDQRVSWGRAVGGNYFAIAQTLEIIPTIDDTSNKKRNFKFWKAIPMGDAEIDYGPGKNATLKVVFHIYPDLSKNDGEYMGYFGDFASGTLVPASQTNSFAGTGNGTIGSFALNDSFTKTETWTVTCIKAITDGGIFSVVGSVSGARGNATVGSSYSSNSVSPSSSELQFTIADGSTDYDEGDTFTIDTVEASYT